MNIENLNQAFAEIAEKKTRLSKIEANSGEYGKLEKEVEGLEGSFFFEYGSLIEEMLFNVYDEYCSDNEVLSPRAYVASSYQVTYENGKAHFEVGAGEGVEVDADDFPGIKARLVLIPNPFRLVLAGEREPFREVVWNSLQLLEA